MVKRSSFVKHSQYATALQNHKYKSLLCWTQTMFFRHYEKLPRVELLTQFNVGTNFNSSPTLKWNLLCAFVLLLSLQIPCFRTNTAFFGSLCILIHCQLKGLFHTCRDRSANDHIITTKKLLKTTFYLKSVFLLIKNCKSEDAFTVKSCLLQVFQNTLVGLMVLRFFSFYTNSPRFLQNELTCFPCIQK